MHKTARPYIPRDGKAALTDATMDLMNKWPKLKNLGETARHLAALISVFVPLTVGDAPSALAQREPSASTEKREGITVLPGIIFIPGFRSSSNPQRGPWKAVADRLKGSYVTKEFKYPAPGGDMANLTLEQIVDAFMEDYETFKKMPDVDPEDMTFAGYSFGAYIAAMAAQKIKVKRIILQALPSFPDGIVNREEAIKKIYDTARYQEVRRARTAGKTDSPLLAALGTLNVDILCISHGNDRITPPSIIIKHCAPHQRATITEIPGAVHVLNDTQQKMLADVIERWLRDPSTLPK